MQNYSVSFLGRTGRAKRKQKEEGKGMSLGLRLGNDVFKNSGSRPQSPSQWNSKVVGVGQSSSAPTAKFVRRLEHWKFFRERGLWRRQATEVAKVEW